MQQELRELAQRHGFGIAWGGVGVLEAVRAAIETPRSAGEFTEEFLRTGFLGFKHLESLPFDARSVGSFSLPAPACVVELPTPRGVIDGLLPPTYHLPGDSRAATLSLLREAFARQGYQFSPIHVPHKTLSARLGLTRYGRNNVTYTAESGSHHYLASFATDAELGWINGEGPIEPRLLPNCEGCNRCVAACPTGAIADDRFMIRHERCLTMWNELAGDFPESIGPETHHALVGCMRCIDICPANAGKLQTVRLGALTAGETAAITAWADAGRPWPPDGPGAELLESASARLREMGCMPAGQEPIWFRNAAVLMAAQEGCDCRL